MYGEGFGEFSSDLWSQSFKESVVLPNNVWGVGDPPPKS